MSLIDEAINQDAENKQEFEAVLEQESRQGITLIDVLKVPTGEGELSEYQNSPLCFDRSEGVARILRGLSGYLGSEIIRAAIVDIILGILQWVKKQKAALRGADGFESRS